MKKIITDEIEKRFDHIESWLENEKAKGQPLIYSSVDIRESEHKLASIDTNIFPAGFNNICQSKSTLISASIKDYFKSNFPKANHVMLFSEDHTRNTFYLENVFHLSQLIKKAGLKCTISTFFNEHPKVCEDSGFLDLKTHSNKEIRIYCISHILKNIKKFKPSICLLNNDLTDGNYENLLELQIPVVPHPSLGWHKRKKSDHIKTLNKLTNRMVKECKLKLDPWLLSTHFKAVKNININDSSDQEHLFKLANELYKKIDLKYKEHNLKELPYLVIKSDNGTYGMGVLSIQNPVEIKQLNRKSRNKLNRGKSSQPIQNLIIQEGIPSSNEFNKLTSEEVIYHLNGTTIGGFYRIHENKSKTDILNSKGMIFKSYCDNIEEHGELNNACGIPRKINKSSYVLAQLANLSAQIEFNNL